LTTPDSPLACAPHPRGISYLFPITGLHSPYPALLDLACKLRAKPIEVDSVNYLIPVDAELSNPSDVKFETVMLDDAVGASLNTGKLSMVLVDACRDNPFAKSMTGGSRSVGRGLSIVDAQPGKIDQIISFAAESGEVAEDGTGNNSPYATALLQLLDEPNLEVGKLFRKLGDNVERMTNGKQIPVTRNRLSGEDIYLVVE